jgi:hypothetical protein
MHKKHQSLYKYLKMAKKVTDIIFAGSNIIKSKWKMVSDFDIQIIT